MRLIFFLLLTVLLTGCSTRCGKGGVSSPETGWEDSSSVLLTSSSTHSEKVSVSFPGNSLSDFWDYEAWLSRVGESPIRDLAEPYQYRIRLLVHKPPRMLATILIGASPVIGFVMRTRIYDMDEPGMLLFDQSRLLTVDEMDRPDYVDALCGQPEPSQSAQSIYSIFLNNDGTRYVCEIWRMENDVNPDVLMMTDPVNLSYTPEETAVLLDSFRDFEGMELHGLQKYLDAYRTLVDSFADLSGLDNLRIKDRRLPGVVSGYDESGNRR